MDIQSRLEPSKLLSENEMLRKRVFELELLVNRKLNELPDEIALLQSENNHLKSLCHARYKFPRIRNSLTPKDSRKSKSGRDCSTQPNSKDSRSLSS